MSGIRHYLFTVILSVLIAGIVGSLVNKKSPHFELMRFISGLFVLLTVVWPLKKTSFHSFSNMLDQIEIDSTYESTNGQELAQDEITKIIKERTEAYICDKAAEMDANIQVSVTMEMIDNIPIPISVKLEGNISPYEKKKMKNIIKNDIGIPEDQQIWN